MQSDSPAGLWVLRLPYTSACFAVWKRRRRLGFLLSSCTSVHLVISGGGVTSSLPSEPSAYNIFAWMKSNFAKLSGFVGGVVDDFGALSSATNLSKILVKSSCSHVEGLKEREEFESSIELEESSRSLSKLVRNFMSSFWLKFGRADARCLVEARRAAVCFLTTCSCLVS